MILFKVKSGEKSTLIFMQKTIYILINQEYNRYKDNIINYGGGIQYAGIT